MITDGIVTGAVVSTQLSTAVIVAYLIQWVKKLQFIPGVNFDTENINRWVAIGAACLTGSGIYITFDPSAGKAVIAGLTLLNVYHFIAHAAQQFALQHATYKGIIAPPLPGPAQQEIRRINGEAKALALVVPVPPEHDTLGGK
jgi:hypothetical protein